MTPSKEDYLKTIVKLGGETHTVNNKQLAEAMQVSGASVSEMNARLLKEELIEYTPYKGVKVTPKGLGIANKLIRKHRIWEVFLAEKLHYHWDEVHQEADHLEHASSDMLIERLSEFLDRPSVDPHGGPIPDKEGNIKKTHYTPLSMITPPAKVVIKEVTDESDFLKYLTQKGLHLYGEYEVIENDQYGKILTLQGSNTDQIILSQQAARSIFVEMNNEHA